MWDKTPKRVVASLELLATVHILQPAVAISTGPIHVDFRVPCNGDNQGVAFALLSAYSKNIPMAAIHVELVLQSELLRAFQVLQHVTRDQNTWADALSKNKHLDVKPSLRSDSSTRS